MVLDLLISPHLARQQPSRLLVASFVFVTFGVLANVWLPSVGGGAILFAMIPTIPLFWFLLVREEAEEEKLNLLPRGNLQFHSQLLKLLGFLLLGSALAYAAWYLLLPASLSATVFADQLQEVHTLRTGLQPATGHVLADMPAAATGAAPVFDSSFFRSLFFHNLNVLFIFFVLSLLYGIGAIYVLLWNASILGVFIARQLQQEGLWGALMGLAGILPHGVLEMGAYLLVSVAGGILGTAMVRGHLHRPQFKWILVDALALTLIAVLVLALGAAVEAIY